MIPWGAGHCQSGRPHNEADSIGRSMGELRDDDIEQGRRAVRFAFGNQTETDEFKHAVLRTWMVEG